MNIRRNDSPSLRWDRQRCQAQSEIHEPMAGSVFGVPPISREPAALPEKTKETLPLMWQFILLAEFPLPSPPGVFVKISVQNCVKFFITKIRLDLFALVPF
jgi:hypothetical protein